MAKLSIHLVGVNLLSACCWEMREEGAPLFQGKISLDAKQKLSCLTTFGGNSENTANDSMIFTGKALEICKVSWSASENGFRTWLCTQRLKPRSKFLRSSAWSQEY